MVSKIAVMAIVGILAVPILLGYALNVEQVTETDYRTTGESVNVTELLQTGTAFSYANGDIYKLNTNFTTGANTSILPIYETSSNKSSFTMQKVVYQSGTFPVFGNFGTQFSTVHNYIYYQSDDVPTGSHLTLNILDENHQAVLSVSRLHSFYYNAIEPTKLEYSFYTNNQVNALNYNTVTVNTSHSFKIIGDSSYQGSGYFERDRGGETTYANISAGYYLTGLNDYWTIDLPDYTSMAILTIDLNSITADNYTIKIGAGGHNNGANFNSSDPYYLTKTTTAGVVAWTVTSVRDPTQTWELYYNPDIPHNTYQIYWDWVYDHSGEVYHDNGLDMDFHDMYYTSHREFRYVGNWPDTIGEANVYWKVTDDIEMYIPMPMPYELPDYVPANYTDYNFSHFYFSDVTSDQEIRTPTVRVDAALFRAFEYQVIEGMVYDPAAFKTNPATTINDPIVYGSSFTFGGNTYAVTKGNITMGNHDIPVKGLVLSSVPNPEGGYDNKIGNTVVSTTPLPSKITFNGRWSASISTIAQEEYEITKSEWKAGDFAWDGMDQNFLMVGLLASLGAFIALGIYARRSKATIWPLLIVCGGAALLFFIML